MNKSHRSCLKLHSNRTEKACNSLEEDSAEAEQVRITACSFLSGVIRTKIDAEAVKQNPPAGSLQVFLFTWRKRRRSKPQPATSSGRLLFCMCCQENRFKTTKENTHGVKSCLEKTPFSKQIARNFWTEDGSGAEKIR
ncbi:hypothetical protein T4A_1515 [Trichinella pseudospiralis]|uniref:Uncharacterized protein n=1 Tax=Trichinella pseudospiralis TaxID=6337 RepID=A0A0V1DU44_TRIPS|nr:hypothetical protein T4A_1515 [Trichinella pseudospiralis]